MKKEFKYDHEGNGCYVNCEKGEIYLTADDLSSLLTCLAIDRVKEVWRSNELVSHGLATLTAAKQCQECNGSGVIFPGEENE